MGHMFNAMLLHKLPSLFPWKHNKTKMMAEPVLEEGIPVEEDLQPCRICGRTFLPTPLVKHVKICEKNAAKKRKVFNSLRQRVEGTDLALFHQKSYLKKNQNQESPAAANPTAQPSSPVAPTTGAGGAGNKSGRAEGAGGGCSKPTWKEKHDQLVESIRAARSADNVKGTGSTSGQQPVGRVRSSATMLNSSFERCPCCDRQFGPKAYDRHVEWCKEKMSRLPASSMPTNQEAKDRLEARTKYRVPPMNKNKKTVKEKYQPSSTAAPASNSQMPGIPNVRSTGNLDRKSNFQRSSSVRRTPSMTNQESPSTRMAEVKAKNAVMGRRTEPIKGKPRISTLKLNTVAVNSSKTGITVSNMHTPVTSNQSTNRTECSTSQKPSTSQKLVTWKDIVEGSDQNEEASAATSASVPSQKKQHLIDLTGLSESDVIGGDDEGDDMVSSGSSVCSNHELTTQELSVPKSKEEVRAEASEKKTEDISNRKSSCNDNSIDLDYVRSCLNSNNFEMLKLSDAADLQSNMLLISTRNQQSIAENEVYIVIKPPKNNASQSTTNDNSVASVSRAPEKGGSETREGSTTDVVPRWSPSKIPIRPGSQLNQRSSSTSRHSLQDTIQKELIANLNLHPEPSEHVDEIEVVATQPVVPEDEPIPCTSKQSADDISDITEKSEKLSESDTCPVYSLPDYEAGGQHDSDPDVTFYEVVDIPHEVNDVIMEDVIISPHGQPLENITEEISAIEELDEEMETLDEAISQKCPSREIIDLSGEGTEIIGLDINLPLIQRNPQIHSETEFQLKKAREALSATNSNFGHTTTPNVASTKSRFQTFYVDNGMGDIGETNMGTGIPPAVNVMEDPARGDCTSKLEVVLESSVERSEDLSPKSADPEPQLQEELKEDPEPTQDSERKQDPEPKVYLMAKLEANPKQELLQKIKPEKDDYIELKSQEPLNDPSDITISIDKLNFESVDDIIFERYGKLGDVESLQGIYINDYSSILSKTRLERDLRGCCSEVTLNSFNQDSTQMIAASETDLLKFNHLQEMMRNHYEEQNPKSPPRPNFCDNDILRNLKISQGTQPEQVFDKCESVQTEITNSGLIKSSPARSVVEIALKENTRSGDLEPEGDYACTTVMRTRRSLRPSTDDEDDDMTTLTESISPQNSSHHSPRKFFACQFKDRPRDKEPVPFATRIYQNCLHHNIIKIKLRKILHNQDPKAAQAGEIEIMGRSPRSPRMVPMFKEAPIEEEPATTEEREQTDQPVACKSTTTCRYEMTYHTESEMTDSECSTISKTSPRFRTLVDFILHERRSEVFRLSRRDCRRLIKLDPKKVQEQATTSTEMKKLEMRPKLPKITVVAPKAERPNICEKVFKSSIEPLPRIVESTSNTARQENQESNITTNTTNNNNTNATTSDKTDATYNPFITAERQLMELLECEDFKPYNHNPTLTNNNNKKNNSITNNNNTNVKKSSAMSPTPKLKSISPPLGKHPKAATAMKRQSVIDPPSDFKDRGKESNVDARDDIDFEMLENFINDNFGNDELMRKLDLDTISLASCSTKTDNNASSFYDDISIDPRLINDFDNLSIPDNLDTDTTTTPDMLHQYPLAHSNRFRLEPLESAQQARNRKASTSSVSSYGDAAMPTHRGDESAKKKSLASLKRAVAITDPVKASKNLRSRDDVENYFNECDKAEAKDTRDARLEFELVSATCAGEELFSVDDEMYEEYKKYEQMYLKEREEQLRREAEMRNNEDSAGHLISGDSAYGSLNRSGKAKVRSKVTKLSPMEPARVDSASSSGSDTCVMQNAPPHPTPMKTSSSSNENNSTSTGKTSNNNSSKLSKFCHECGNRYPLTTAKFCVECGVRRLPEIDFITNSDDEYFEDNEEI